MMCRSYTASFSGTVADVRAGLGWAVRFWDEERMAHSLLVNKSADWVPSALNDHTSGSFLVQESHKNTFSYHKYFPWLICEIDTEGVEVTCCRVRETANSVRENESFPYMHHFSWPRCTSSILTNKITCGLRPSRPQLWIFWHPRVTKS